jgi:choline kinase
MKGIVLAGGLGTRISEETYLKPKPMVEIGGRDEEDDWKNAKILCNTLEDLIAVITEATTLTRE